MGEVTFELNGLISVLFRGRKIYVRVLRIGIDFRRVGLCSDLDKLTDSEKLDINKTSKKWGN